MRNPLGCLGSIFVSFLVLLSIGLASCQTAVAPEAKSGVWARVTLLSPAPSDWRTHIIAHLPSGKPAELYAAATVAPEAAGAGFIPAGTASPWIDLSTAVPRGVASVRFLFETQTGLGTSGIKAKFDIATAPGEAAIVRTFTETDTGNVISLRIPADLVKDKQWLLSIREDTARRLREVEALHLPDTPLPKKIWTMTGFRSNGQFYTDPAIAQMDFDITRKLGMNGFWEQNGGQPGALRGMAAAHGMDRSTVYWRAVASPPTDATGAVVKSEDEVTKWIDSIYHDNIDNTRKAHHTGMPTVVVDLMDEPAGITFDGPEYQAAFQKYLQTQGLAPDFFGKASWPEVISPRLGWREFFVIRAKLDTTDIHNRRLLYWAAKYWNIATARMYAAATKRVEEYAPQAGVNVIGTRINFGPPWLYDYGSLPRGIDAFEFGRQHSVSLGFNEDWVGKGSRRFPLESNTLLIDWSRAAARPATPLLGSYITRDADRNSVKLRTFACLAREAKIFDFYYYGPAYTFFDHWSDNASMVQGVGELTRDIGAVDEQLWNGRAPKAQVALLYPKSWPVWKADDSEQTEQMMVYLALLHAGIPVDLVSDEDVSSGRFATRGYKCLYVVNESIPAAAATAIDKWVRTGGRLWASGWAGMRDEYNSPTDVWNDLLGVKERSWKPTGYLKRLGDPIEPADWKRPSFNREVSLQPSGTAAFKLPTTPAPIIGSRGAYGRSVGRGQVQVVPWSAGKEYMDAAVESESKLGHTVIYPTGEQRSIITNFAFASHVEPPATTSVNQILAWPLWSQKDGVVLLANYTGAPANVTVRFETPKKIKRLRSLRNGSLKFTRPDARHISATLPMADVTDILIAE